MTRLLHATLCSLLAVATVAAQDKTTIPLSSPSQPATVKVRLITGSINVTPGSNGQVVVESTGQTSGESRSRNRERTDVPPGMHRLDSADRGFTVEENHNVVTISPETPGRGSAWNIQVPPNASLELKTVSGGRIDVTGISGDVDAENMNGDIVLRNISGAVSAHTLNGTLTASIDRVTSDKPMSFTSLNGKIDVTLPASTKARLRIKNTNGEVYSDFDVKMEPDNSKPAVEQTTGTGGRYRIHVDRGVYGSINGGGPEYLFQTMNGSILIHKK